MLGIAQTLDGVCCWLAAAQLLLHPSGCLLHTWWGMQLGKWRGSCTVLWLYVQAELGSCIGQVHAAVLWYFLSVGSTVVLCSGCMVASSICGNVVCCLKPNFLCLGAAVPARLTVCLVCCACTVSCRPTGQGSKWLWCGVPGYSP